MAKIRREGGRTLWIVWGFFGFHKRMEKFTNAIEAAMEGGN